MTAMEAYTLFPTALGSCGIAWRGDTVTSARLPDDTPAQTARKLASQNGAQEGDPPAAVQEAITAIQTLFAGEKTDLSFVSCDFGDADPFARSVYQITRHIPAGETTTYGAIATELGDLRLSQRVGWALGRNPIPIIMPCHRVLGADGKLTGFSATGGVEMKCRMLEIEGAQIGGGPGLFDDLPLAVKPGGPS